MDNWKIFREKQPEVGKTVLIWRSHRKQLRYTVAKLESYSGKMIWRSFSNNMLKIEEKDMWLEFPYVTITNTYN